CQVAFHTPENQREHMKSDWHRYNLKRKVVDLPPVTAQVFIQKVQSQQEPERLEETFSCQCCRKKFQNESTFENHQKSKKHIELMKNYVPPSEVSSDTRSVNEHRNWKQMLSEAKNEDEVNEILAQKMKETKRLTEQDCLFCHNLAPSFEENLEHMAKEHSFFLPDMDRLEDPKGLVQYLGDKIAIANLCIFCNGKGRAMHSTEAVKAHMISKSHCKIPYDDDLEEEIADFYNYEDEEWEDVDGVDATEDDDEEEEEEGGVYLTADETQLVLPSGVKVGHRAFRRYWKQNLRPIEVVPGSMRDPEMARRVDGQYKMLGYKTPAQFSRALIQQQQRKLTMEKHVQAKVVQQRHNDFRLKVGIRGNNQKHFRDPTGFIQ
ncbi:C2H2 type zinc-finger-domain-containing protein, partial [Gorgonomyces haynaldii]